MSEPISDFLVSLGFDPAFPVYTFDTSGITLDDLIESMRSNEHGDGPVPYIEVHTQGARVLDRFPLRLLVFQIRAMYVQAPAEEASSRSARRSSDSPAKRHLVWYGEAWNCGWDEQFDDETREHFASKAERGQVGRFLIEVDPATGRFGAGKIQTQSRTVR